MVEERKMGFASRSLLIGSFREIDYYGYHPLMFVLSLQFYGACISFLFNS